MSVAGKCPKIIYVSGLNNMKPSMVIPDHALYQLTIDIKISPLHDHFLQTLTKSSDVT